MPRITTPSYSITTIFLFGLLMECGCNNLNRATTSALKVAAFVETSIVSNGRLPLQRQQYNMIARRQSKFGFRTFENTQQHRQIEIIKLPSYLKAKSITNVEAVSVAAATVPVPAATPTTQASLISASSVDVYDEEDTVGSTASFSTLFNDSFQNDDTSADAVYRKGLMIIGFITLLFASNSPVLHAAYSEMQAGDNIPVLLLNAACSVIAMIAMFSANQFKEKKNDYTSIPTSTTVSLLATQEADDEQEQKKLMTDSATASNNPLLRIVLGREKESTISLPMQGGIELGMWKFLGTVLNIYGLSLTSAGHGAFLIQLTTLFVPLTQGIMGVPIPRRIWIAIGLALSGVFLFTSAAVGGNASSSMAVQGDIACIGAAVMYATYDLRLFHWGKLVEPLSLITTKIATQTSLSIIALFAFAFNESMDFMSSVFHSPHDLALVTFVILWSGLAVNAVAPYLQVGGQQAVGPARAQVIYASQPLWAASMSFVFLGETLTIQGMIGSALFLTAVLLAATAESPNPNCDNDICET